MIGGAGKCLSSFIRAPKKNIQNRLDESHCNKFIFVHMLQPYLGNGLRSSNWPVLFYENKLLPAFVVKLHEKKTVHFEIYCRFELKHFAATQAIFLKRKVGRIRFYAHQRRDATVQKKVNEITMGQKILFFEGNGSIPATSPIEGYVRLPNKRFRHLLKEKCDVVRIDEFHTTKLCSKCFWTAITALSPHRYQYWKNCNTTWNRDVNAARNILYKGHCIMQAVQFHPNFRRAPIYV